MIPYLEEADVVITNPPFSLFREYIKLMTAYNKDFLVMGNNNAITYKNVFPLIRDGKVWLGVNANKTMEFALPNDYEKWDRVEDGVKYGKVPAISWFTTLEHDKRDESLKLTEKYYEEAYPLYDNYKAINVDRVDKIPKDFKGVMGVPITFLTKFNPKQFKILSSNDYIANKDTPKKSHGLVKDKHASIGERIVYARILIKRKSDD